MILMIFNPPYHSIALSGNNERCVQATLRRFMFETLMAPVTKPISVHLPPLGAPVILQICSVYLCRSHQFTSYFSMRVRLRVHEDGEHTFELCLDLLHSLLGFIRTFHHLVELEVQAVSSFFVLRERRLAYPVSAQTHPCSGPVSPNIARQQQMSMNRSYSHDICQGMATQVVGVTDGKAG